MAASSSSADVAVVGLGRVGLPLALSFAARGLRTIGVDKDGARLQAIREGRMPFAETGAAGLWSRCAPAASSSQERVADAAGARHIVLTLGTPSFRTSRSTCAISARPSTTCSVPSRSLR